jgi:DNA processing protein
VDAQERTAWLRLTLTRGLTASDARRLLAAFEMPQAVFEASYASLARAAGEAAARAVQAPESSEALRQRNETEAWLQLGEGRDLISLADPDYPPPLLEVGDPPPVLYLHGKRPVLGRAALAIIGSRSATRQGEANAEAFAEHLSAGGLTIISGLARGIDAAAHRGALHSEAGTLAVLGTGIDVIYPRSNRELTEQIRQHGLVVSEFAIGSPALSQHFPQRNRLIAALSLGVLVVEAASHSGSLIKARLAGELGREVMAIPGSIHSPVARGCHRLIREGARLVESAQDVLDEIRVRPSRLPTPPAAAGSDQTVDDPLLRAMGHDPVDLDTLARRTGTSPGMLSARLLQLELTQDVERLPGNTYQRLRRR